MNILLVNLLGGLFIIDTYILRKHYECQKLRNFLGYFQRGFPVTHMYYEPGIFLAEREKGKNWLRDPVFKDCRESKKKINAKAINTKKIYLLW